MHAPDWYRLGDGYLAVRSEHAGFRQGFSQLFAGCRAVPPPTTAGPTVTCDVQGTTCDPVSVIQFDDPEPLDVVDFAAELFADRGCREVPTDRPGGRAFAVSIGDHVVVLTAADGSLIADNAQRWEWLVGNIAVHRVIRLQSGVAALHAASMAIGGCGVLLVGPKASGKTTLALALTSRGHGFLGDEIAALRVASRELLPLRRSVSVRRGPASRRVEAVLEATHRTHQRFPDGEPRLRAEIDQLFPDNVAAPVPLGAVVFLRSIGVEPRLERIAVARSHLKDLTPLRSTLWHLPPATRAMRLLAVLSRTPCFCLDVGDADRTADLIEGIAHTPCH